MPETHNDPFSKFYDALWAVLEANPTWAALVAPKNRVKFSGTEPVALKEEILNGDRPEVRIVPVSQDGHKRQTSHTVIMTVDWHIQIASGDLRMCAALFPVFWQTAKALEKGLDTLRSLTWNDAPYVVDCTLGDSTFGVSEADLVRGIKGWITAAKVTVVFGITKSELLA